MCPLMPTRYYFLSLAYIGKQNPLLACRDKLRIFINIGYLLIEPWVLIFFLFDLQSVIYLFALVWLDGVIYMKSYSVASSKYFTTLSVRRFYLSCLTRMNSIFYLNNFAEFFYICLIL